MTSLVERQRIIGDLKQACHDGARLYKACEIIGISLNCWYRWQQDGTVLSDRRSDVPRGEPSNKLSEQERSEILTVCNGERFGSLPPRQIVPLLADEGRYLASESSFYRVLKQAGQTHHRGRASLPRKVVKPTRYTATAPNQVWTWDITWLPSTVKGHYYKLYLIEDSVSRFPVGCEVHAEENGELAAELMQRSVLAQYCAAQPLVLHSDNGAPMKSYRLKAKLEALGIVPSYSRPRVSNDNSYSEALFRTLKYCPRWPRAGFSPIEQARQWVQGFIDWYSQEHRHSGIRFVTPSQRHHAEDKQLLQARHEVYQAARNTRPNRWSRVTRNWEWMSDVQLNPDRKLPSQAVENRLVA